MTSATLYREGPDLDALLAELDAEHGGNVRVLDVDYGRDGGVMGFFAKRTVGVHFVVDAEFAQEQANAEVDAAPASPLEAMLRAAEAAEMVESGRAPAGPTAADDNLEFARMLLDIATQKAAARAATEPMDAQVETPMDAPPAWTAPAWTAPALAEPTVQPAAFSALPAIPVAEPAAAEAPVAAADFAASRAELLERVRSRPIGAHRVADEPAPTPLTGDLPADWRTVAHQSAPAAPVSEGGRHSIDAAPAPATPAPAPAPATPAPEPQPAAVVLPANPTRSPLTLRRQLSEIGVPLGWIPDDSSSAYAVIEQLVRQVPVAAPIDLGPGQLLVVAGPAAQAQAEAVRLAARLRLDPASIRTAGCGADPIRHRRQAAALELDVRGARTEPCIVVVATDSSADLGGAADLAWAADIVAALAPDHLLLVVDATCRVSDARTTVAAFGTVSAIAIVAAARTASPAAMWELGVPVASLDGREASRGSWAALLIDRLTALDGA